MVVTMVPMVVLLPVVMTGVDDGGGCGGGGGDGCIVDGGFGGCIGGYTSCGGSDGVVVVVLVLVMMLVVLVMVRVKVVVRGLGVVLSPDGLCGVPCCFLICPLENLLFSNWQTKPGCFSIDTTKTSYFLIGLPKHSVYLFAHQQNLLFSNLPTKILSLSLNS